MQLFISSPPYLEQLLTEELQELGIAARPLKRGVCAPLSMRNVYIINYASHLAVRVLWPLSSFPCLNREMLYEESKKIPWSDYILSSQTFALDTHLLGKTSFNNSHFAGLVVKDAICDQFREKTGSRPSVQLLNPDVQIDLTIENNQAVLSLDTSGIPLFKRGYRSGNVEAPLQETLAAALLRLSEYNSEDILCDPYCGSGTLLWEAAFLATQTPAGFFRNHYAFFHHPLFSQDEWISVKNQLNSRILSLKPFQIFGGDRDLKAIELCRKIQENTQFPLYFQHTLIQNFRLPQNPSLIVANPPYGRRLKTTVNPYASLEQFLTKTCQKKSRIAVLSPHRYLTEFNRESVKTYPLMNGGLNIYLHYCSS